MMTPSIFGENLFDDFFDDFFDYPVFDDRKMQKVQKKLYGRRVANMMKTDVQEHDDHYEVDIDLPGFKKDEVKVSLESGYLTISATKGMDNGEQKEKTGRYIRRDRYTCASERSFYVGEDVINSDIKGQFKHGVLKLHIFGE